MKVEGSIVVITGGAGGIGEALVAAFVKAGAEAVVVHDRDIERSRRVASLYVESSTKVLAEAGDVSAPDEIERLVAGVEERFGRIDIFCSNAGIMIGGGIEVDLARFRDSFDINVLAHVRAARAAVPSMLQRGRGHFLNVASAAGMLTAPGAAPYAISKHGALGFSEWLAIAYGDRGISVSVLCPEAVDTAMLQSSLEENAGVRRIAESGTILDAATVANGAVEALKEDRFLVCSHPDTLKNTQRKWADPDRWLKGMRSFLRSML